MTPSCGCGHPTRPIALTDQDTVPWGGPFNLLNAVEICMVCDSPVPGMTIAALGGLVEEDPYTYGT